MAQAGEYYCRATTENGAIKSKPATLSVIGELLYNRQKKTIPTCLLLLCSPWNLFLSKKIKLSLHATQILNPT